MNSPSAHDEFEAIDSANVDKDDPRRGSSIFSGPGAMSGPQGGPSPASNPAAPVKRQSVALQPMSGLSGLVDFDSDLEESDEDEPPRPQVGGLPGYPMPGGYPGAPRGPPPPMAGGPNHRPLVGGFAAAAYEAARSFHYQHQIKKPTGAPKRTTPPPSI
jgi:hypothetical protein